MTYDPSKAKPLDNALATMALAKCHHSIRKMGASNHSILKGLTVMMIQTVANEKDINDLITIKKFGKKQDELLDVLVAQMTELCESHLSDILESA